MTLTEAALAKVNLALHVVGRRADGYHELESLVVFADVGDELEATEAERDGLSISGPFGSGLSAGETNLVSKAVTAFRRRWPDAVPGGIHISLQKNLPVAAGLGGGSADAAAVLRLLAGFAEHPVAPVDLAALGATIGADVPACLVSQPLELRGVGEVIEPVASFPRCHLVLINPLVPVVTAEVFRRLDGHAFPPQPVLPQPLSRPELALWLEETRNDLEPPAIRLLPVIAGLIESMRETQGCVLARMSGSGGTVFGLFGSSAQAHQAAHDLRARWPGFWVAAAPVIVPG